MSVYADKYFGYVIDVADEYKRTDEDFREKYYSGIQTPEFKEIGYVPQYSDVEVSSGDITLINDGMSGEYTRLVYVLSLEKYSDDYTDTNPLVNKALEYAPIPDEVVTKLIAVYKMLFGTIEHDLTIRTMLFTHFH